MKHDEDPLSKAGNAENQPKKNSAYKENSKQSRNN